MDSYDTRPAEQPGSLSGAAPPLGAAALQSAATYPPMRSLRLWPAVLTLVILAPVVAEMLSGSTPPLLFINPVSLAFQIGLYGSGAVLARELARRRRLGWTNILILGAAYGVLEEGLVVTSWFNPHWPDLGALASYGRVWDTNTIWALGLTAYHAVVSITIPIVLAEAFFPTIASRPWLSGRSFRLFAGWLALVSLVGLLGFGFLAYRKQGYAHPPVEYFLALALAVALTMIGLRWCPVPYQPRLFYPVPRLWTLRLAGFAATITFFFTLWVLPAKVPAAWITALAMIGALALVASAVRRWSARPGWSRAHRLALASGVLSFFLLLAPLFELGAATHGKPTSGMILVASFFAALLIMLARRLRPGQPPAATSAMSAHTPRTNVQK